jgi:hypothetical protein
MLPVCGAGRRACLEVRRQCLQDHKARTSAAGPLLLSAGLDDSVFDDYVLGERYPRLHEVVLGMVPVTRRGRRGRQRDSWMRLLVRSGLVTGYDR